MCSKPQVKRRIIVKWSGFRWRLFHLFQKHACIPMLARVTAGVSSITAPWLVLAIFCCMRMIGTLSRSFSDKVSSNCSLAGSEGYSNRTSVRTIALYRVERFPFHDKVSPEIGVQPVYWAQSHWVQVCRQGQGHQSSSIVLHLLWLHPHTLYW